eukprot:TCALIF_09835-PA protein Name:"Protein of unknown function" AED:0.14 eAED:0.14 QI:61/1/0.66/1/1/0.66/3/161/57
MVVQLSKFCTTRDAGSQSRGYGSSRPLGQSRGFNHCRLGIGWTRGIGRGDFGFLRSQ